MVVRLKNVTKKKDEYDIVKKKFNVLYNGYIITYKKKHKEINTIEEGVKDIIERAKTQSFTKEELISLVQSAWDNCESEEGKSSYFETFKLLYFVFYTKFIIILILG